MYYSTKDFTFIKFVKSNTKNKMYDAIIQSKATKKVKRLPFGLSTMGNYRDITGLNLYPNLIHNDPVRRKSFKARFKNILKDGYYSPGYFSYYYLW
jgi:hypothetical protein